MALVYTTVSNDAVPSPAGYGQHLIYEVWNLSCPHPVFKGEKYKQLSNMVIFVYWLAYVVTSGIMQNRFFLQKFFLYSNNIEGK